MVLTSRPPLPDQPPRRRGDAIVSRLLGVPSLDRVSRVRFRAEGALRVTRRVALVAPVVAVISAAHVVALWTLREAPDARGAWASDVVGVHLALAGFSVLLSVAALVLRRREGATPARAALGLGAGWIYLGLTAYLAGIDQQVTPNITPFIVGGLTVALLFPMPPLAGLVGHLGALALFVQLNDLHQADALIRLSNRGNALAISLIAFMLARVLEAARAEELKTRLVNERQQAELEAANAELNRLATRDALTGLENRRSFLASAERLLVLAARTGRPASVLMLDVDHFKAVNDVRGHAAGDEALRAVAEACVACLRASDTLGRTGGEEFAAVLSETDVEAAMEIAHRIRARVETLRPLPDDPDFSLTISVGVAPLEPGGSDAVARALARADAALYAAKESGRNRVVSHAGETF